MTAGLAGGLGYGLFREQQPVYCGGRADVDELRARVAAISRQLDGASAAGQSAYTGADFKDELHAGIAKLRLAQCSSEVWTAQMRYLISLSAQLPRTMWRDLLHARCPSGHRRRATNVQRR